MSREEDPAFAVLDGFRHLVSLVHASSRESEKLMGLSVAQHFVLRKLSQAGTKMSIKELAAITHTHQSSVSVVASKLIEKKLIAKSKASDDARKVELRLTAKGQKLMETVEVETAQDRLLRSIRSLDEVEQTRLRDLVDKVLRGAAVEGPAPLFLEE